MPKRKDFGDKFETFLLKGDDVSMINGFRCMWILVMFDLPTDTKKARKEYTLFRKHLLESGFTKMQYSVYTRFTNGMDGAKKHIHRVKAFLPPGGEVRILCFTDKQFETMQIFFGKTRKKEQNPWQQLTFF